MKSEELLIQELSRVCATYTCVDEKANRMPEVMKPQSHHLAASTRSVASGVTVCWSCTDSSSSARLLSDASSSAKPLSVSSGPTRLLADFSNPAGLVSGFSFTARLLSNFPPSSVASVWEDVLLSLSLGFVRFSERVSFLARQSRREKEINVNHCKKWVLLKHESLGSQISFFEQMRPLIAVTPCHNIRQCYHDISTGQAQQASVREKE